jgi:hypothetical protein
MKREVELNEERIGSYLDECDTDGNLSIDEYFIDEGNSPIASENSWEILSPTERMQEMPLTQDAEDHVIVIPANSSEDKGNSGFVSLRAVSTPDFISLERTVLLCNEDEGFPKVNYSIRPKLRESPARMDWKGASFRDIVLSRIPTEVEEHPASSNASTSNANRKYKPRIVVTPTVRPRRFESTPDLCSLNSSQVLGESDAMDFYQRKAKGISGRKNGMKMRPDEAKRLDIIMSKKEMQRQMMVSK